MGIKLTCPRCKTPLQVPTKLLGQYTQCPACQNRILIPPNVPVSTATSVNDSVADVAVARAGQTEAPPIASAPSTASQKVPPPRPQSVAVAGAATAAGPKTAIAPQAAGDAHSAHSMPAAVWSDHATAEPASQRKVARFITADSAPSTVQLAPDGELPKLQLTEGLQPRRDSDKGSGLNPLVVVGAACLSFCLCIVLLLVDFEPSALDSRQESRIRQKLESYYKDEEGPLAPYQVHLREAEQARSRGDRLAEQRHYRKVLDLLHAECDPRDRFGGLTGTPKSDNDLERLLATLLAGQADETADEGS